MTTENRINKTLEAFNFFKIEVIADFEFEGKIIKNYPHCNNDSVITSKNWEQNKNTFFDQRMQTYKETFTLAEKINLEIENLEALTTNENEYRILKNRYKLFLSNEQITPQQFEPDITDEVRIIDKLKQNEFDDVEPSKVYQHFKQLVDNKYITNENFNLFLISVFEQNKTLTTKIEIIKANSKQRVQKIFYSYFEKFAQNKYGTKQTYIDLLCNNFTGFNSKTLSTNFAK